MFEVILSAMACISFAINLASRSLWKTANWRLREANRSLLDQNENLRLSLNLSKSSARGPEHDACVAFYTRFERKSSLVDLEFGSVAVVYHGERLDSDELDDWSREALPAYVVAQFCTTEELQGWLGRR